jgi:hypothetical protein
MHRGKFAVCQLRVMRSGLESLRKLLAAVWDRFCENVGRRRLGYTSLSLCRFGPDCRLSSSDTLKPV